MRKASRAADHGDSLGSLLLSLCAAADGCIPFTQKLCKYIPIKHLSSLLQLSQTIMTGHNARNQSSEIFGLQSSVPELKTTNTTAAL
jgi:hypothetical protein